MFLLCIINPVKVFRRPSVFAAIVAVAAWANVQVMACCWSFSGSRKASSKIETAQMQPGHACCHKHADVATVPVSAVPPGTAALHSAHGNCGGQHEAPALQSHAPALDLTLATSIQSLAENIAGPSSLLSATPVHNTGPPVFLVFQRLLI